ncbi:MAG TPA: RNA polymerase sigma factor [Urbifossiella sp.]
MSDEALVRRCLAGDPAAARELVERFQSDVFGLCARLLGHRHDAEDVTQDVFLRIFRSLRSWDASRPLKPWITTITVNRCRTAIGKRANRPELAEYLHETPDHRQDDDSTELTRGIRAAVDQMRPDYRMVFILFHEHGQAYEEISEAIGRPVGTVKTWLHRARIELLEQLRTRGLVPEDNEPKI